MRKDFSDGTSADMSISDLISSSTVKIVTFDKNGGTGTGFFFDFNPQTPETMDSLAIVTNWHVV